MLRGAVNMRWLTTGQSSMGWRDWSDRLLCTCRFIHNLRLHSYYRICTVVHIPSHSRKHRHIILSWAHLHIHTVICRPLYAYHRIHSIAYHLRTDASRESKQSDSFQTTDSSQDFVAADGLQIVANAVDIYLHIF